MLISVYLLYIKEGKGKPQVTNIEIEIILIPSRPLHESKGGQNKRIWRRRRSRRKKKRGEKKKKKKNTKPFINATEGRIAGGKEKMNAKQKTQGGGRNSPKSECTDK